MVSQRLTARRYTCRSPLLNKNLIKLHQNGVQNAGSQNAGSFVEMKAHRLFRWLRAMLQPAPMFGMAIIAIFWFGLALLQSVERSKTLEDAIQRGDNLTRLFEENTIRLIKGVDRTLLLLRLAYETNSENFDLPYWAGRTSLLGDLTIQATFIGSDGYMKTTTTGYTGPPLYLGDREHFQAHVNAQVGRSIHWQAGSWARIALSIQLARRLRQPDGSFGGIVVASIDPAFVEKFYHSVNIGSQGSINLRGLDGVIRASYGFSVAKTDKNTIPKGLSTALARAPAGYFWGGGVVDGINRLASYRVIAGYPLVITIGMAEREIFADYGPSDDLLIGGGCSDAAGMTAVVFSVRRRSSLRDEFSIRQGARKYDARSVHVRREKTARYQQ